MSVESLSPSPEERQQRIVSVLGDAFGGLIEGDPRAMRRKFRKMAADPFAFYRGSAPLFYEDMGALEDRWADERTSRVWIQGDLHAENYGTYMNSAGVLVFDVNDFDEAYVGHFTWDLRRMAASLALLAFSKALSDQTIQRMAGAYARSYLTQVRHFHEQSGDEEFELGLDSTDGTVLQVLAKARQGTRIELLQQSTALEGTERRFREMPGVRRLDGDEEERVRAAYEQYLKTIPEDKRQESVSYTIKDIVGKSGMGIGSAGLPMYSLLVEGRTQALENDIVLSMKQAGPAAPARVVDDEELRNAFEHSGHRTAVSQRALQAHADPWLGWCELDGRGQVVKEISPYEADLDWDEVTEPDEILPLLDYLGQATAKVHCVADADSDHTIVPFQSEEAIMAAVGDEDETFATDLAEFAAAYGALARDDHRLFVDAFRNGMIPGVPGEEG
ncbi:MAG: DUF2252 domain-containing protein [Actinomycetota bacterium]|nr:DUF2252 domain-containing protein [Actinomycetota bacterium]